MSSYLPDRNLLERRKREIVAALLKADEQRLSHEVSEALQSGIPAEVVYLDLLLGAEAAIGELWHKGEIGIVEEHQSTQFIMTQLERVRSLLRRTASSHALRAVVCAADKDPHWIGARAVSDLLAADGWHVDFLGGAVPTRDLVKFVSTKKPKLVCLSVSCSEGIPAAREALEKFRALESPPRVVIGGPVVREAHKQQPFEADAVDIDIASIPALAREFFGLENGTENPDGVLQRIGERVRRARQQRGLSQDALASASNLDRAYISGIENGKQNPTVLALLRLTTALGIRLADLLLEEGHAINGA